MVAFFVLLADGARADVVRLPGHTLPALARSGARPTPLRAGDLARPTRLTLTLRRSHQAAFERYLRTLRRHPGRRLDAAALTRRFGPSRRSYAGIVDWLRGAGLRIGARSPDRLTLTATAPLGAIDRLLDVDEVGYRLDGRRFHANRRNPALPARLARHVQAISGLSDVGRPRAPLVTRNDVKNGCGQAIVDLIPGGGAFQAYTRQGTPDTGTAILDGLSIAGQISLLLGKAFAPLLLIPTAWDTGNCIGLYLAYVSHSHDFNLDGKVDGFPRLAPLAAARRANPQKIGLLEFDTFDPADVQDWLDLVGLAPDDVRAQLQTHHVNGGVASPGAGESEVLLDVDTTLVADQDATIAVYDAPIDTSFEQLFNAMIADGVTVISNSWSQCEDQTPRAEALAIDSVLAQAAAAGISVFNGTGDHGSTCLDGSPSTVGVPADSPHATAVGGTSPRFGDGLTYAGERWWGADAAEPPSGQGGFGVSIHFPRPSYQDGHSGASGRSVPDVALDADPSAGVGICQADAGGCPSGALYGGTSMATPALAGLTAQLNERLGRDVGEANPVLYGAAAADATTFHDADGMGSDFAHVGLGSPDVDRLALQLTGRTPGPVDGARSTAFGTPYVVADGSATGVLRVDLADADGYALAGHVVRVTPAAGTHATVSPASGPSDRATGSVTFRVADAVDEPVAFSVEDVTAGVTLADRPTITFVPPPATSGGIVASPGSVAADGSAAATLTVTLHDAHGHGAKGKTIAVDEAGGHAVIAGAGATPGVTDANGVATFTVTDLTAEAVTFSADDVTDGDLPVPGSARVTFSDAGGGQCPQPLVSAASGYASSVLATGFPNANLQTGNVSLAGCGGPLWMAYDAGGSLWVPDIVTGDVYRFGAAGGTAGPGTKLTATPLGPWLFSLAFGKDGRLYGVQADGPGANFFDGRVLEIDPSDGSVVRVVASGLTAPCQVVSDPVSGDLFVSHCFNGFLASPEITRIADPAGAAPQVSAYASPGSVDGLAFDPDGALYARGAGTTGDNAKLWRIAATDSADPGHVELLDGTLAGGGAIAVLEPEAGGRRATLALADGGGLRAVDLDATPPAVTPILTTPVGGATLAPDGCLAVTTASSVLRVTSAGGGCPFPTRAVGPSLTLSSSRASAPTGDEVQLSARLVNVPAAAGATVEFDVAGANDQVRIARAGADGVATTRYRGRATGLDRVQAFVKRTPPGPGSATVQVSWTAGRRPTFLSLNGSPEAAQAGRPVTLTAHLSDVGDRPATPLAGARVTISAGGAQCDATTGADGDAACALTPSAPPSLVGVSASFAGDAAHAPSDASASLQFGVLAGLAPPGGGGGGDETPPGGGGTTPPRVETGLSSPPPGQPPSARPASVCGKVAVDLMDVYVAGRRIRLVGYADPALRGKRVTVSSTWNGKTVARGTVGAEGYFRMTAALPPARLRTSNRARYRATIGSVHSPALKLARRLYVVDVKTVAHGRVRISGRVSGPLTRPPAALVVSRRDSCQTAYRRLRASARLNRRSGAFTIVAPAAPASARGAVYRVATRVRRGHGTFATQSLPRVADR